MKPWLDLIVVDNLAYTLNSTSNCCKQSKATMLIVGSQQILENGKMQMRVCKSECRNAAK